MGSGGELVRRRVLVSGHVQGVWFRQSCQEQAIHVGVTGWVRNLPDGRVEACFEGAGPAVDRMVRWCHHGPPRARVRAVLVAEERPAGASGFEVR